MAPENFHHPYTPYDIQIQLMQAIYDCIEQGKVGIFESPTGTGKSLSLICSSLTWLREHKRKQFDEAMASVSVGVDDDEPDWMMDHARTVRSHEVKQMRAEFEERLAAVRRREAKVRERAARTSEPASKRQRQAKDDSTDSDDEDDFILDDYVSGEEDAADSQNPYSAETSKLMANLGLLPKPAKKRDTGEDIEETKVFFCSRTHSQLSQFIGELKRVKLPPGLPPDTDETANTVSDEASEELKHLTLGSRKNLCINPKVNRLTSQTAVNERCVELQQASTPANKKCPHLPNKDSEDQVLDFRDHALASIRDIEDLAKLGSKLQICPYYASRPAIGPAEIVTLPYPLLLQKSAREALGISVKGHVVVIDEAHNLLNAVEGIYSAQIRDSELRKAKDGLIIYLQKFRNRLKGGNRTYLTQVVRVTDSLLSFVTSVKNMSGAGSTTRADALLAGKGVDQVNLSKLVRYMNESKLARKVEGYLAREAQLSNKKKTGPREVDDQTSDVPVLMHLQNFLLCLMNPSKEGRFLWSREDGSVVVRYLLLDPSEHFRDVVEDARSVVLAGGTMSPMEDYKQQLFPYLDDITTFQCGHLVPPTSLFVRAISSDDKGRLDYSFKSRTDANAERLGKALAQIASQAESGMVVFFPSYSYLDSVCRIWKTRQLLHELEKAKPIFFDDRAKSSEDTFRAYREAVAADNKRGALLFSVIGGKLSEGINFSDDLGRCVVVVGLPYPNLETADWKAKMQYLEDRATARGEVRGKASREHAENVCMRSVNQAIGRAIRHKNDWASILLLDARYAGPQIQAKLPGWIQGSMRSTASGLLRDVVNELEHFFRGRSTP